MNGNVPYMWDSNSAAQVSGLMQQNSQYNSPNWTMSSALLGHAFGTLPPLPNGYNRTTFNEERAWAANSYKEGISSALWGGAVIGASTYGVFGNPLQDLVGRFTNQGIPDAVLRRSGFSSAAEYMANNQSKFMRYVNYGADASGNINWNVVGGGLYHAPTNWAAKGANSVFNAWNSVASASFRFGQWGGGHVGEMGGHIVGQATRGILNAGGAITEGIINKATGGMSSAVISSINTAGADLALDATQQLALPGISNTAKAWHTVRQSVGGFLQSPFRVTTASVASGIAGGGRMVGAVVGGMLNPLSLLQMYATDKAFQYAGNMMDISSVSSQIEADLMAKSDRILRGGASDMERGVSSGMTSAQRNRTTEMIKSMAMGSAMGADLFGMGKHSIFGGQQGYADRLKELKAILNVGTDMGMFDYSKSFDDFEKKFKETVKVVDKMSKLIQKSKGEVMALVAGMQQEGIFNPTMAGKSIENRDVAARLTGVDLSTTMLEGSMGAQMSMQRGLGAQFGGNRMAANRRLMGRAISNGDLSREDIFNMGGEQQIITSMTASDINLAADENVLAELAFMVERGRDGKVSFNRNKLAGTRADAMSAARSRIAKDNREWLRSAEGYSRTAQGYVQGGLFIDRAEDVQMAIRQGKITGEDLDMVQASLIMQSYMQGNPTATKDQQQANLVEAYVRMGTPRELAIIKAKNMSGGYSGAVSEENRRIAASRFKDDRENNRVGYYGAGYYAANALGAVTSMFTGKTWQQASQDMYYSLTGETGGRTASDRAFVRYQNNEAMSISERVANMSSQEMRDAIEYNSMRGGPVAINNELAGVNAARVKGVRGAMDVTEENKAIRAGMKRSRAYATGYTENGGLARNSLESFIGDAGFKSGEKYYVAGKLIKQAAAGNKVFLTEQLNADVSGALALAYDEMLAAGISTEEAQAQLANINANLSTTDAKGKVVRYSDLENSSEYGGQNKLSEWEADGIRIRLGMETKTTLGKVAAATSFMSGKVLMKFKGSWRMRSIDTKGIVGLRAGDTKFLNLIDDSKDALLSGKSIKIDGKDMSRDELVKRIRDIEANNPEMGPLMDYYMDIVSDTTGTEAERRERVQINREVGRTVRDAGRLKYEDSSNALASKVAQDIAKRKSAVNGMSAGAIALVDELGRVIAGQSTDAAKNLLKGGKLEGLEKFGVDTNKYFDVIKNGKTPDQAIKDLANDLSENLTANATGPEGTAGSTGNEGTAADVAEKYKDASETVEKAAATLKECLKALRLM